MRERITVYQRLGDAQEFCDLGYEHTVRHYARKTLGPVVEMREHNNGYEKRMTEVRKDAQGREYHQRVEIDFYNNVWWLREDGERFDPRPRGPSPITVHGVGE